MGSSRPDDLIALDIPAEPPPKSVVLDHEGMAWQRFGDTWVRCGTPFLTWISSTKEPRAQWVALLAQGPVRVIWWASVDTAEEPHAVEPEDLAVHHVEEVPPR